MPTPKQARLAIASLRAAFGITALVRPQALYPSIGLKAEDNKNGAWIMRAFGSRELALAVAESGALGKQSLPVAMRAGAAVDAVDTVAYGLAYRAGRVSKAYAALFAVVGVVAVALGLHASREEV